VGVQLRRGTWKRIELKLTKEERKAEMPEETAIQLSQPGTALSRPETFAPRTLAEAMEFAKLVLDSGFAPKAYQGKNPASIVIALQLGLELNLQPMQALQSIALINNTPAVFGDTALALIKASPNFDSIVETLDETTMTATCMVKRRGQPPVTRTFSKVDATTAGLWAKAGPWTQYPKRMLQMRARSFAIRDQFPDVLKGIATAEEAQDYAVGETIEGQPQSSAPAPAAEKAEETIGQAGGSDFYKRYKASGWLPEEAKVWLRDNLQIGQPHNDKNSKDIPASKKEQAFAWADSLSPIKTAVNEKFETLGFTHDERVAFFTAHKDFATVDKELAAEIERRNKEQRGE
jgi:hypothetical protein